MFPLPLWFHYINGWLVERVMRTPLVSTAQVQMLAEGLVEPAGACAQLPPELAPKIRFTEDQIRNGLPAPGAFGMRDLRCCHRRETPHHHVHGAFFEMP